MENFVGTCIGPLPEGEKDLGWEITLACNARCSHCMVNAGAKNPNELTTDGCLQAIDDMVEFGITKLTVVGGEPTLRSDLFEILPYAKERIKNVRLFTNGSTLGPEMITKISQVNPRVFVSVDHHLAVEHDEFRGQPGLFEHLSEGIQQLAGNGVNVGIDCMITGRNYRSLDKIVDCIASLGATSIGFFWMLGLGRAKGKDSIYPPRERYAEIMDSLEQLKKVYMNQGIRIATRRIPPVIPLPLEHCMGGLTHVYLRADGALTPCINILDKEYTVYSPGMKLADAVESAEFQDFRRFVDTRGDKLPECNPCDLKSTCGFGCPGYAQTYSGKALSIDPLCYYQSRLK